MYIKNIYVSVCLCAKEVRERFYLLKIYVFSVSACGVAVQGPGNAHEVRRAVSLTIKHVFPPNQADLGHNCH